MNSVSLLNISIHNLSLPELLARLTRNGGFVVTPNVDHMIKLQKDKELLTAYQKADYRVCDSKIVEYTLKFLGTPIKEKISGSDLFPAFYNYNRDNEDIKIFLLGGQAGVPEQAQANINAKVGRNMVVEAYSPSFGFEKNEAECLEIIEKINQSGATVLAIGVGAPKQEKWIIKYRHLLPNIKIFLAIGATIDFEAGNKSRSPKWVSEAGLEWLYRLASEPRRLWKRYLVESLPFFALVLKQKLHLGFTEPVINENALSL
jgi:exopolysaccharide biosynthesis WecB/TagA/CpsF family protein